MQTLLLLLALLLFLLLLFLLLVLLFLLLPAVYTESATETTVATMAARVASSDIADVQIPCCLDMTLVMQLEESEGRALHLALRFACSCQKVSQDSILNKRMEWVQ